MIRSVSSISGGDTVYFRGIVISIVLQIKGTPSRSLTEANGSCVEERKPEREFVKETGEELGRNW